MKKNPTHRACELCRQRKRKCDGDGSNPCKACEEGGLDCVYIVTPRVSKAELRDQLARLQSINSQNDTLFNILSSRKTSPGELHNILRRLSDGQPRAEVASLVAQKLTAKRQTREGTSMTSLFTSRTTSPMSPAHRILESSPSSADSGSSESSSGFVLSDVANPEANLRTDLEYHRSRLPQLLDVILAKDGLLFCPISKNHFNRDFECGYGTYCSTALVDSLLALAALLAKDRVSVMANPTASTHPGQEDLGQVFTEEAISALYNGIGLPRRIADIQALGILSLYCLGRNQLNDGRGFASDFGAAIIEQWRTEQPIKPDSRIFPDIQAHASIYCAAVSLNRILFLVSDYDGTLDKYARETKVGKLRASREEVYIPTARFQVDLSNSLIDDAFYRKDLNLIPDSPRVIAAKLFELTEWTYEARSRPHKVTFNQAVRVYNEGLRWYESFFRYTSGCGNCNTPLILFVQ
ncbi:hypothetical protein HC256_000249 [Beauveria bassiana]|nr:hypothetical protein HC256_000249 [Beauveria bassiana]